MDMMVKWIGGTTATVLAGFGALLITGDTLQARADDPDQWLQADDTLAEMAAPAPHPSPVALVRPAAPPAPAACLR